MLDIAAEVGVEIHVEGSSPRHLPFNRQAEVIQNLGAGSVRADQKLGAHPVTTPRQAILQRYIDTFGVLFMREIFGVE